MPADRSMKAIQYLAKADYSSMLLRTGIFNAMELLFNSDDEVAKSFKKMLVESIRSLSASGGLFNESSSRPVRRPNIDRIVRSVDGDTAGAQDDAPAPGPSNPVLDQIHNRAEELLM